MTDIEKLEKFKNITIHYGSTFGMHIEQLKEIQEAIGNVLSDLYEANNRIADLLLILGDRDRMIDLMVNAIYKMDCESEYGNSKEAIRKYFKERCK